MSGMNYLTIAYLGMIVGLGVWTWTVVSRSRKLESRLAAMEESFGFKNSQADSIAREQIPEE